MDVTISAPEKSSSTSGSSAELPAAELPESETLEESIDETTDITTQSLRRTRRRPTWMQDYEITGVGQHDNAVIHFALFADCDPTTFEVAIKEEKSQKAMDAEMEAI